MPTWYLAHSHVRLVLLNQGQLHCNVEECPLLQLVNSHQLLHVGVCHYQALPLLENPVQPQDQT